MHILSRRAPGGARLGATLILVAAALTAAACGSSDDSGSSSSGTTAAAKADKPVRIAYLSFAVAIGYDAPMLAAWARQRRR